VRGNGKGARKDERKKPGRLLRECTRLVSTLRRRPKGSTEGIVGQKEGANIRADYLQTTSILSKARGKKEGGQEEGRPKNQRETQGIESLRQQAGGDFLNCSFVKLGLSRRPEEGGGGRTGGKLIGGGRK